MKTQGLVQYLRIPSWFGFECRTTTKTNQAAEHTFGESRGLDYEDSPTWITQFWHRMRKLWCLEGEKKLRENYALGFLIFSSWNEWEGKWGYLNEMKRGKEVPNWRLPPQPAMRGTWASRGQRGCWAMRLTASSCASPLLGRWPSLLPSHSSRVLQQYSGLQTPISNLSSNYESLIPHTQEKLWNFDKRLRIRLGIWQQRQLNEWDRKVA